MQTIFLPDQLKPVKANELVRSIYSINSGIQLDFCLLNVLKIDDLIDINRTEHSDETFQKAFQRINYDDDW